MRALDLSCALALIAVCAASTSSAHAVPRSNLQVTSQPGIELVADKSTDEEGQRSRKSKKHRVSEGKKESDGPTVSHGSRTPGSSIPMTARGAYLYGPSFNGAYTPPSGYSTSGYPIYRADEVAEARSQCASLRSRAMASGKRSAWDRYYACKED